LTVVTVVLGEMQLNAIFETDRPAQL
jgi:hypothetical protein